MLSHTRARARPSVLHGGRLRMSAAERLTWRARYHLSESTSISDASGGNRDAMLVFERRSRASRALSTRILKSSSRATSYQRINKGPFSRCTILMSCFGTIFLSRRRGYMKSRNRKLVRRARYKFFNFPSIFLR